MSSKRPVTLFLNSGRLNYDNRINFTNLSSITNLTLNNVDIVRSMDEMKHIISKAKPEIIITKEMELPKAVVKDFPTSVKLLCEAGTGYNNIPIVLAREKNIDVVNIPTYSTESVAHMVITYIMNFSAAMFDQAKMLFEKNHKNFYVFQHPISEINGKTLGLIGGAGTIGTAVADVAIPLGMKIIISSRKERLPTGHKYENHPQVSVKPLEVLLRESDYVSINTPLNNETRHSIGRKEIELMKPTAFLINTARGAIIKEKELIECMKENKIAGAGLDTQEVEPPSEDSELWTAPNIFLTPHIGWRRLETRQRLVDMTTENIESYIRGELINV